MTDHTTPIPRTVMHDYSGHTVYLLMVAYAEQHRALVSGNWAEANRRQMQLDRLQSLTD